MALRNLHTLQAATHAAGALATRVGRDAIYGTRRFPSTNAGMAPEQRSAIGIGRHSVWQGQRQIRSGAPIVKRNRPA